LSVINLILKNKMKKITIATLLMSSFFAMAQRTCGMQEKMEQIMSDPIQKELFLQQRQLFDIELQKLQNNTQNRSTESSALTAVRIPVAVHFPDVSNTSSATVKTCLRNLAQSQINILNADYNAANTDLTLWTAASVFYPGVTVGNLNVQFELATQNHPAGTGLSNGTVAVTFGTDFLNGADSDSTWAGYINIVVRYADGDLGYSPLPGIPALGYTVVIDSSAFGSGSGCSGYQPSSPYNKGRTLTHELGHFFNLDHTFASCGSVANCSTTGDGICDTPPSNTPTFNCPSAGSVSSSCSSQKVLTMNYMDYTNDACMYMFTTGQEQRMRAQYNAFASQLTTTALSNIELVKSNYTLAPNPNNGSFTLTFKDLSNDYLVEVFDISGRVVYENYFTQNSNLTQEVKIENPSSGIYFVNVKSGSVISTEKIIIK
jgi:hypothetical protein